MVIYDVTAGSEISIWSLQEQIGRGTERVFFSLFANVNNKRIQALLIC